LQDGCPRCLELAEWPIRDLDETMLANLVALAVDPERLSKGRSEAELIAAANVLSQLERTGRLVDVAPQAVEEYLRDHWKVDCEIRSTLLSRLVRT
jgi:hypothetical protein